jgi:hypothetical protein
VEAGGGVKVVWQSGNDGSTASLDPKKRFRPFAAVGHHLKMLQRGPSLLPFAATAKSARGELTDCGTKPAFAAPAPMAASARYAKKTYGYGQITSPDRLRP